MMKRTLAYFSREVVAYAVWVDHRFAWSTAGVEDLLTERDVIVSLDAIRLWLSRFCAQFAACIRRDRPGLNGKRHKDEGEGRFKNRPAACFSPERSEPWV